MLQFAERKLLPFLCVLCGHLLFKRTRNFATEITEEE
jgi:hypothetical protein